MKTCRNSHENERVLKVLHESIIWNNWLRDCLIKRLSIKCEWAYIIFKTAVN